MPANNFTFDTNTTNLQEYLFKLIPDLSVFDVVERDFIDTNRSERIHKLFFYNPINSNTINFRRFIVKSNIEFGIDNTSIIKTATANESPVIVSENIDTDIVFHKFEIEGEYYLIIIDEQFKSGGFRFNKSEGSYSYIETSDTSFQTEKTYYEYQEYFATSDTSFQEGKTYYEHQEGEYVATSDTSFQTEKTYYEYQEERYVSTSDTSFQEGKTYYEYQPNYVIGVCF